MRRIRRAGNRGISLVEMLIVSVIVVGMCGVLAAVLRMGLRTWEAKERQMTVSFELRRSIQWMARELAQTRADLLSVPADGNFYTSIQFQVPQDVNGDGTVLDNTGTLEWNPNTITYSLGGLGNRHLQRNQAGSNIAVLGYGMTALQFRRQAATPSILELSVTAQRGRAGDFAHQANLTTRIRLRN